MEVQLVQNEMFQIRTLVLKKILESTVSKRQMLIYWTTVQILSNEILKLVFAKFRVKVFVMQAQLRISIIGNVHICM